MRTQLSCKIYLCHTYDKMAVKIKNHCYAFELRPPSPTKMLLSKLLAVHNIILFGDRVFTEVIKLK